MADKRGLRIGIAVLAGLWLADAAASGARPEDWAPATAVKRLATGTDHSCAIMGDGTVHCWGRNTVGQLGIGNLEQRNSPASVPGVRATFVSAGFNHTCVVSIDNVVLCWGGNLGGKLGTGDTLNRSSPALVANLSDVRSVSAGDQSSCAVLYDGTVRCWGSDEQGQLGDGVTSGGSTTPVQVQSLTDAVQVEVASGFATGRFACALRSNGRVSCWGEGTSGQLGNALSASRNAPVQVQGLSDAIGLALGESHACALRRTGAVVCWGDNGFGQLGNGTTDDSNVPVPVSSLTGVTSLTAGRGHTCARRVDGTVRCWGGNANGQLGDGTTQSRTQRVTVSGLASVLSIAAGFAHSCALLANDTLRCWGSSQFGQLGNGSTTQQTLPAPVSTLAGAMTARLISAGASHACAIRSTGALACWGNNGNGQLGDGTTTSRALATAVPGQTGLVALATGSFHTCTLRVDGLVSCWGSNGTGQIGNGVTGANVLSPFATSITDAVALVAGTAYTCALRVGGSVRCWGDGRLGQLGDGALVINPTPVQPSGLGSNIVALGAGVFHTCALRFDGSLRCWGRNEFGQVGDGTGLDQPTQRAVSGPANFVAVELGGEHSCAVRVTGELACWGENDQQQLGIGIADPQLTPILSPTLDKVRVVSGGGDTTCAFGRRVNAAGSRQGLVCFGRNDFGQTGAVPSAAPATQLVTAEPDAPQAEVGFQFACAIIDPGTPWCWGRNTSGQAGRGTVTNNVLPAPVPSFALNLAPDGALAAAGHGATITVLAICKEGAQARLEVAIRQGDIEAVGQGLGHCTGVLQRIDIGLRTRRGAQLDAGPVLASAVARIVAAGDVIETTQWSREVLLNP